MEGALETSDAVSDKLKEGWQTAKEKIDRFYGGDSETNLDPRIALSIEEDEHEWHESEGGILVEQPLQDVTLRSDGDYGDAAGTVDPQESEYYDTDGATGTPGYAETSDQPAEDAGPWEELYSDSEDSADAEDSRQPAEDAGPWEELYSDSEDTAGPRGFADASEQPAESDDGGIVNIEADEDSDPWGSEYDDAEDSADPWGYADASEQPADPLESIDDGDRENDHYEAGLDNFLAGESDESNDLGEADYSTAFESLQQEEADLARQRAEQEREEREAALARQRTEQERAEREATLARQRAEQERAERETALARQRAEQERAEREAKRLRDSGRVESSGSGSTGGSCSASELASLEASMRKAQTAEGYCNTARALRLAFRKVLEFYNRCPGEDPNGEMRQYAREMIDWANETEKAACAD